MSPPWPVLHTSPFGVFEKNHQPGKRVAFFLSPTAAPIPDLSIASDAAGGFGLGAFWQDRWFSHSWSFLPRPFSITFLELVPGVVASQLWVSLWRGLRIQFACYNAAVVAVLNMGSAKSSEVMHLVRVLISIACDYNFTFAAIHVLGAQNSAADALSRLQVSEFRRLKPDASPPPMVSPHCFPRLLLPPPSFPGVIVSWPKF